MSHKGPSWYVAESALPSPLPSLLLFGQAPDWDIGFTRARWRELMNGSGAKGLKSYAIGVLTDRMIDPSPKPPTLRELRKRAKR